MNNPNVGVFISSDAKRDAIHVAICPVVAGENLIPGEPIALKKGTTDTAVVNGLNSLGIVDPFLPGNVKKGQRFWMFLNPKTITSLRHEWVHPSLPLPVEQNAEAWLADKDEEIERLQKQIERLKVELQESDEGYSCGC